MSDDDIYEVLKKSEKRAQESMKKLGMDDCLKRNDKWEVPPLLGFSKILNEYQQIEHFVFVQSSLINLQKIKSQQS
jgi:hypothetical protein